jgi:sulfoxide reductase heme-binding subunit YedZ
MPWRDRAGNFSWLRALIFGLVVTLLVAVLGGLATDSHGAEPLKGATKEFGELTLRWLIFVLAITPLRRITGYGHLIGIRRMVGLSAFIFVFGHFALYVALQDGDLGKVISEVSSRIYLTIGFIALIGLSALAVTSFDRAIRAMGRGWHRLHRLVYPLTALGLLHFFMQSKFDVSEAAMMSGIFTGLMVFRLLDRRSWRPLLGPVLMVIIMAISAGVSAALWEYLWHLTQTGVPADRVLMSNFDFEYEIRHPWIAAAIMMVPALFPLGQWLRRRLATGQPPVAARKAS